MFVRSILRNAAVEGAGGTAAAPPPAETSTESTPAEIPAGETKLQKRARTTRELDRWMAEQKAAKSGSAAAPANDNADKPAPTADAPSEAAEKTAEAIEEAGGKAPEKKAGESDAKYEKRLLDALQKQRELEGETARERKGRTEAEAKAATVEKALKELEAKIARGKDPEQALEFMLEHTGLTFEDLVKGIKEKKIKAPGQRAKLDPEAQARLDKLEAENKRLADIEEKRQAEQTQRQQQEAFRSDVVTVERVLKESLEDYPLLAASAWAPEQIVRNAYATKRHDVHAIAKEVEENTATNIAKAIGEEKGFKKLLKFDPELKAKLIGWLDVAPAAKPEPAKDTPAPKRPKVQDMTTEASVAPSTSGLKGRDRQRQAASNLDGWLRQQAELKAKGKR